MRALGMEEELVLHVHGVVAVQGRNGTRGWLLQGVLISEGRNGARGHVIDKEVAEGNLGEEGRQEGPRPSRQYHS